ncbi:MAG: hypothetical protein RBR57_04120 [Candidatus Syntrophosphaera sp.]|jgi:hypothetical protein|nr:hypothetical protein [Candidatus Cloacimonadota bacterium]MDD5624278.1 hypothetical protein [Candidatus Cloacimonadota bacterium]MDY0112090.1 hypothetical protein [Candidatus Syntrophosphaera sp.]
MISCLQDTFQSINEEKVQTFFPINPKTVLASEILRGKEMPDKVFFLSEGYLWSENREE